MTSAGNTWAKKGTHLPVKIRCNGSGPLYYCVHYCHHDCSNKTNYGCLVPNVIQTCDFEVNLFVFQPVTLIVVLGNDVSKVEKQIEIKLIVDPGNQGQLSVVLVPVIFILLALTGVIYGVAYYVQNRRQ